MNNPMKLKYILSISMLIAGISLLYSFTPYQQSIEWKVPDAAKEKKNPVAANDASLASGKAIYTKSCYDCHGKKGKGDGPKSADLDKNPKDFTKADFQKQSDGTLFYKITEGRKPMPSFKKDLTDDQRWQVINYIRTLQIKK